MTTTNAQDQAHADANREALEALQHLLFAMALQALKRDGRDAALLHLDRLETGAARLQFLVILDGNDLALACSYRIGDAATPLMTARLIGPKPQASAAH